MEKFHTFCYGRSTYVLSNHKPLASIVHKDLVNAPPRLQRLLLRLQKYNVYMQHKPGKSMIFADHLSRNVHLMPSKEPTLPSLDLEISLLELNASPSKLELIKQKSERDPQMLLLKKLIIQGWPKDIKECPTPVKSFWNFRDELSIIDGIVVKGNCNVIPISSGQSYCHYCMMTLIWVWTNVFKELKAVYIGQTFQKTLSLLYTSVRNV